MLPWLIRTKGKTPGPPGGGQGCGAGQTELGPWALCVVGGVAVPAGQIQYTGTFWQGAGSPHLPAGAWRRGPQALLMEVEVAVPLDWNCEQDPEPPFQGLRSTCQQARARRSTPGLLDRRRCPGTRRAESGPETSSRVAWFLCQMTGARGRAPGPPTKGGLSVGTGLVGGRTLGPTSGGQGHYTSWLKPGAGPRDVLTGSVVAGLDGRNQGSGSLCLLAGAKGRTRCSPGGGGVAALAGGCQDHYPKPFWQGTGSPAGWLGAGFWILLVEGGVTMPAAQRRWWDPMILQRQDGITTPASLSWVRTPGPPRWKVGMPGRWNRRTKQSSQGPQASSTWVCYMRWLARTRGTGS